MSKNKFHKVFFQLVDEDGYPPISIESLNAKKIDDKKFQLDNTPFFIEGVSLGDVVSAELIFGSDERYWFNEVLVQSDNRSLSIIIIDSNRSDDIFQQLKSFGCYCEYGEFGNLKMLAVSVMGSYSYDDIFDYLEELEKNDILSFAELAV